MTGLRRKAAEYDAPLFLSVFFCFAPQANHLSGPLAHHCHPRLATLGAGETAAGSGTIQEGDENIEKRRTQDPTQDGQVDLDGEADTEATGGGKQASGKADDFGMSGGARRMDSTEAGSVEGMEALSPRGEREKHLRGNFRLSCRAKIGDPAVAVKALTLRRGKPQMLAMDYCETGAIDPPEATVLIWDLDATTPYETITPEPDGGLDAELAGEYGHEFRIQALFEGELSHPVDVLIPNDSTVLPAPRPPFCLSRHRLAPGDASDARGAGQ